MEVVLILVVTAVVILAIKIAMTSPKESSNIQNQPDKPNTPRPSEEIEFPPSGYFYHEMVGMYYHGVTPKDLGIFKGKAIAETNNPKDKFAVGIYRNDDNKLVGYIPKDFRGVSNEKIHKEITESGGSREVVFKISGSEKKCYGTVYIKNK
ncbi:MAG: hypothetical protein ACLT8W_09620 [Bacteroides caccae]